MIGGIRMFIGLDGEKTVVMMTTMMTTMMVRARRNTGHTCAV